MTNMFIDLFPQRYKVSYNKQTGECRLVISMTFIRNKHGETSASASLLEEGKDSAELSLHDMNCDTGERLCVC